MIRSIHKFPGLFALILLVALAISGTVLSIFPAIDAVQSPGINAEMNVADLATKIQSNYPTVEQIKRAPSGKITAYWFDNGAPQSAIIDPNTGLAIASADPNAFERWMTEFHRSLFLDDTGRWVTAFGAVMMLVLAVSGTLMVKNRVGGWSNWFDRLRGPVSGRIHVEIARISMPALAFSALSGIWMTASVFGFLPDTSPAPAFPAQVSGVINTDVSQFDSLASVSASNLRELSYPYPDDATDVFTLKTDQGIGYIDQSTGALLAWQPLGTGQIISEFIYMLHTGAGASWVGLILGLASLGIPVLGGTGVVMWMQTRRLKPRFRGNHPAATSDTIILVGSESGSTWGFADTLKTALNSAGRRVHIAALSAYRSDAYKSADTLLILAATYGDGSAPASARGFLDRFAQSKPNPNMRLAVLGFGDKSFPAYCAYARDISNAAKAMGWITLTDFATIDRQSAQEFARWGTDLGRALGIDLTLSHTPQTPKTTHLHLINRQDFGAEVQSPTAILRFELPKSGWFRHGLGRFQAGDLVGIIPDGSSIPRYYSLASGNQDGYLEIVVKKHAGGLCSNQLLGLDIGDTIGMFLRRNPAFHAGRGRDPLILIGAGTGIGPLLGMIRANTSRRPINLFFGIRHPDSDFLYQTELNEFLQSEHLTQYHLAASRSDQRHYVQDAVRANAQLVADQLGKGAKIMICGGRDMAAGVIDTLHAIGFDINVLKSRGQLVEDVY